jgi:hypothetical protein
MKNDKADLNSMLKILYLSADHLQKNKFRKTKLSTITQEFKLKLLNSKNLENSEKLNIFITDLVNCDLDDLLILKVLYSINFKETLDQQNIKRTIPNTLLCTYSSLSLALATCDVTDKSYLLTLIIQNAYQYYKLKYYLTVNVEKNCYEP